MRGYSDPHTPENTRNEWAGFAKMRSAAFSLIFLFCAACTAQDPIDSLVTRLSSNPMWINGITPLVSLPETTESRAIIAECFKMTGFDEGHVKRYKILEIKKVKIDGPLPDDYIAALVETDLGEKIVLFQHSNTSIGWWTRVYDSKY